MRRIKENVAIGGDFIYNLREVCVNADSDGIWRIIMSKVAVMTDSNSGITQIEAKEMGIAVLPMPFIIDDKIYYEDISLTQEEFYEKLAQNATVSTSQPSVEDVTKYWDKALEDADEVVYIPMSSGLSGSCSTAQMLSQDYDGRVQVVDNQRISVTQRQSAMDAIELAERGMNAAQIKALLEQEKMQSSIYIMLDTLTYLKKGGRITPAAAALGTALRLKPVLQIQGEKLDAFTIARTKKQGVSKMIAAMETDIKERFGGLDNMDNIHIEVAHTANEEAAAEFVEELREHFRVRDEIVCNPLSLSVSCHIGPGALAVACSKAIPK